jgi:hypothetical protein
LDDANDARAWCVEVNGRQHSETRAVPDDRVVEERGVFGPLPSLRRGAWRKVDELSTVRFGSAHCSVPRELVGRLESRTAT